MNETGHKDENKHIEEKLNYVYMIECSDGTYYTGWTTHLKERVQSHNGGNGAKYTRSRRPVHLVYYEICTSRSEALKREYEVKHLSRTEKERMVREAAGKIAALDMQGD